MTSFKAADLYPKTLIFQEKVAGLLKRVRALSNKILNLSKSEQGEPEPDKSIDFDQIPEGLRALAQKIHQAHDLDSISVGTSADYNKEYSSDVLKTLDHVYDHYGLGDKTGKRRINTLNLLLRSLGKRKQIDPKVHSTNRETIEKLKLSDLRLEQKWTISLESSMWNDLKNFANGNISSLDSCDWYSNFKDHPAILMDLCMGVIGRTISSNEKSIDKSKIIKDQPKLEWLDNENIFTAVKVIAYLARLL